MALQQPAAKAQFEERDIALLRREAGEREGPNRDSDWEGEVVLATDTHLTRSAGLLRLRTLSPRQAGGEGLLLRFQLIGITLPRSISQFSR